MAYDPNRLERSAKKLMELGRHNDALAVYFYMADGDPSLDAGWLGMKIGECYEAVGDLHAARYWHGRAVEENPGVRATSEEARKRLASLSIDDLLISD
jgi:hypothetical protein